jgi:arylformamidase
VTSEGLSYWNRQFQFARLLPGFQDILTSMQARSDAVAVSLNLRRVAYGPHPRQWVEVSGEQAGAVLPVFIHGGYWRALEAERHRFVLPRLRALTGAVANLEYRLMPEVSLAEIVADACAGLRMLAANTGCRLLVIGHSAGGHLAVTAAHHLPHEVAGAMAISGLYDLTPLPWSFLREEIGLTAAHVAGQSPQHFWQGDAASTIIAVGAEETGEFRRQAQMFAATHGTRLLDIPGAHHMSVLDDLTAEAGHAPRALETLLQEISA